MNLIKFFLCAGIIATTSSCMNYEKRVAMSDYIGEFKNGYAICVQEDKYFFISENGEKQSDEYDKIYDFKNGYAVAYNILERDVPFNDKRIYFYLDEKLNVKKYPIVGSTEYANEWGNVWVTLNGKRDSWSLFNIETGNFQTPFLGFPDCFNEDGSVVVSRLANKSGLPKHYEYAIYNGKGEEIVPFGKYSYIGNFNKGRAIYSTTGTDTYKPTISSTEFLVPERKEKNGINELRDVRNDLNKAKIGYINLKGNPVSEEIFNVAGSFNDAGYAHVGIGDFHRKDYIIDVNMNDCTNVPAAIASFYADGRWKCYKNQSGVCSAVNNKGEIVVFGDCSNISSLKQYIMTRQGNVYKLYTMDGNKPKELATFSRERSDENVILHSTWDNAKKEMTEGTICFVAPKSKRMSINGYYDKYTLSGMHKASEWGAVYRIDGSFAYPQFIFE